ncbi:uncharacterized protein YndB with AHSA1/START domain [Chitinophaga skermanii]|uniref:Uncharacterized protein YndB with AHSA1/START domain n=1 Tax=Chitinophaga skermanii TaxID=331697 RepID=A0A327QYY6_9BACT|nr:SRPBCC domain-containing protein [Chitinophaga skermanii]RAJ08842.1 uncharacterized protein YndB with AHSA1/START domain [Chitinophaga skermanii]
MNHLEIKAAIQIAKPIQEVFEAIVDPQKMSNYFIAKGSARMETGKTVTWQFPEFPDQFNITVLSVSAPSAIAFEWEGAKDHVLKVDMQLQDKGAATVVRITEGTMPNDEEGIKWLRGNTEGWANFLACLKAYLEYNINLRTGAFDYMKG